MARKKKVEEVVEKNEVGVENVEEVTTTTPNQEENIRIVNEYIQYTKALQVSIDSEDGRKFVYSPEKAGALPINTFVAAHMTLQFYINSILLGNKVPAPGVAISALFEEVQVEKQAEENANS